MNSMLTRYYFRSSTTAQRYLVSNSCDCTLNLFPYLHKIWTRFAVNNLLRNRIHEKCTKLQASLSRKREVSLKWMPPFWSDFCLLDTFEMKCLINLYWCISFATSTSSRFRKSHRVEVKVSAAEFYAKKLWYSSVFFLPIANLIILMRNSILLRHLIRIFDYWWHICPRCRKCSLWNPWSELFGIFLLQYKYY